MWGRSLAGSRDVTGISGSTLVSAAESEINTTEPESISVPTRYLGKQPILDRKHSLYGHELLFRAGPVNAFSGDPEEATRQVIDNYLFLMAQADLGIAFVNCTRHALVSGVVTLLPPQDTVLEILENIDGTPDVVESCAALKQSGYRFALDDFTPSEAKLPLLQFADYIKVDFQSTSRNTRREIYALAKRCGSKLIAEKVETANEVEVATSEGCELFQGYFFSKPIIAKHRVIPQNHVTYLQLLVALDRPSIDIDELENIVKSETSLCYRLLRLVNSALYSLPSPVSSIRTALLLVGENGVRKLVTLALAGVFAAGSSRTLVALALERAKFCELLSPTLGHRGSKLYLLGMLSLMDAILQVPMAQIVQSLPLDAEMKDALLGDGSTMSMALDFIRCYEAGDWDACEKIRRALGLSESHASVIYIESVRWSEKIMDGQQSGRS